MTLENLNNTIQGAGIIGDNGLSVLNDAGGTILANAPGQNLYLDGVGTLTNNGTFQANAGSQLVVENTTTFTNFSGNTLTGGTYNVIAGPSGTAVIEINNFGNTGGEIVNNAATISAGRPRLLLPGRGGPGCPVQLLQQRGRRQLHHPGWPELYQPKRH